MVALAHLPSHTYFFKDPHSLWNTHPASLAHIYTVTDTAPLSLQHTYALTQVQPS